MPLVYQQNINETTQLGIWHIEEEEEFFLKKVTLQRDITHPHKRLQHLAGRFLLRELYPDFPLDLIMIADTRKPFLPNEAYHFSISHCRDYAAVIVSKDHRVGVDIEMVNEKIDRIVHKFLSEEEQQLIGGNNKNEKATLLWSVKECIFKWFGDGEVDFKKHIHIKKIENESKEVTVSFLKREIISLQVNFFSFDGHFVSWVATKVK